MTEFYAYDNHHRDRARVHRAECPWCNHGQGVQGGSSGPTTNGMARLPLLRMHTPAFIIELT